MLRLLLLGRPQVFLNQTPVVDFVSEKALALLAYLALHPGSLARNILADLLWGEMPEARARANLRMALYNLQQLIPGCLTVTRVSAELNRAAAVWLDVEALAAESARLEAAAEGPALASPDAHPPLLQLYRGDFLDGLSPEGAPAFEEWLQLERQRLRQLALRVLEHAAEEALQQGRYPLAIQTLRRLLDLEPWQESAHRRLMLALARTGDATGALAQYAACRQALAEGLGLDPTPETTALAERIRAARQRARRHNLPLQPFPLVGRLAELARLHQLLGQPQTRLITLTGPGGIGKTRLAAQVALDLSDVFFEGVFFVPLAAVAESSGLAPALLDALNVPLQGTTDPWTLLRDALGTREILLVLDNFEHLLDGAPALGELLRAAPGVRLLVTSRERLSLQWETTFPLEGLETPGSTDGQPLEAYGAVQFFLQCSRRVRPSFTLSGEDQAALLRLCQITEGLPLALELAAAWIPSLSLPAIAEEVQANLHLLASNLRDAPPRHRSLRAAIAQSWERLSNPEREVFRRLAIFRGTFSLTAAEQVVGALPEVLSGLSAKSLLRQDEAGRYDLHEVLRQFGLDELRSRPDEWAATGREHSRFYAAFLEQRETRITGAEMAETLQEIRAEVDNVRAAWQWAAARGEWDHLDRGRRCLSHFYELSSLLSEGESAFALAVDRLRLSPDSPASLLARLLIELARFQRALAKHEPALQTLAEALAILEQHPDPASEAIAHLQWAEVQERQGDFPQAGQHYAQALALARTAARPDLQGGSHIGLGIVAGEGGDIAAAVAHFQEAQHLSASVGDRRGENVALHNLAIAATYLNDTLGARHYFEQELELVRRLGNRRWEVMTLLGLTMLAGYYGEYAQQQQYSEQALHICQEIGERREAGTALEAQGMAALFQGRFDEAAQALGQAQRHHIEAGNRLGECITRLHLGLVQRAVGQAAQARAELETALAATRELKVHRDEAVWLAHLSITHTLLSDHPAARQSAQQALEIAEQLGDAPVRASALSALGRALEGLGDIDAAVAAQEQALALRREAGQEHLAVENAANLALLHLARHDQAAASVHAETILGFNAQRHLLGLEPLRVYLAVYQTLQAANDPRARPLLAAAHEQLLAQAATIPQPAQRKIFLEQVPVNRAILHAIAG